MTSFNGVTIRGAVMVRSSPRRQKDSAVPLSQPRAIRPASTRGPLGRAAIPTATSRGAPITWAADVAIRKVPPLMTQLDTHAISTTRNLPDEAPTTTMQGEASQGLARHFRFHDPKLAERFSRGKMPMTTLYEAYFDGRADLVGDF